MRASHIGAAERLVEPDTSRRTEREAGCKSMNNE
jgi:hypothetical protein